MIFSLLSSGQKSVRLPELLGLIGLFALALAWLIPDKVSPWPSFWNEAAAGLGLLLLALVPFGRTRSSQMFRIAWPLALLAVVGIASAWAQWGAGLLLYAGDAWLVSLYLGLFGLAVLTGRELVTGPEGERWANMLLVAVLLAGLAAAGAALLQWSWGGSFSLMVQEMPPGRRAYANLGQPNHASTLFFMSLCCALQLRRKRAIGAGGTLLAVALLTLAMGVAGSRTGLLQLALLAVWSIWLSRGDGESGEWRWGATAFALGLAWWLGRSGLTRLLDLPDWPTRELGVEATSGDLRFAVWHAFLDAVWQHPWAGWGWQQTGMAQQAIAACHTNLHYYFNFTHMLVLDWVVWLGLPLGLTLAALLGWWLLGHLPKRSATAGGYWMAAVLGLLVHSMLEYPFAYTYFLLPAGLMMGVIDARHPNVRALPLKRPVYGLVWLVFATLAAAIMWDAGRAVPVHMDIRFEASRIGQTRHAVAVPEMLLLDQLEDFLAFNAADVTQPIPPDTLAAYGRSVKREPLQYSLLRYSMMLQVAGHPNAAARAQQQLCDFFGKKKCLAVALQWKDWQKIYANAKLGAFQGQPLPARCPPTEPPPR